MNDLISVVIPTYNRRDKLPACIASVLAQTYRNIEVIVVDDASTDGTERLFDRDTDPRVHYVRYGDLWFVIPLLLVLGVDVLVVRRRERKTAKRKQQEEEIKSKEPETKNQGIEEQE